jgi:Holliday junction resolvasome RuvABC endonuclease subunit
MILAIDPGLANFGAAIVTPAEGDAAYLAAPLYWRSEASSTKRKADDKPDRARDLARWLDNVCEQHAVRVVAAESLAYFQGVQANVAAGLVWGVIASVAELRRIPVVAVMSSEWRKGVARDFGCDASEAEVHRELIQRVSHTGLIAGVKPWSGWAHVVDALGIGVWSLRHPTVRAAIAGAWTSMPVRDQAELTARRSFLSLWDERLKASEGRKAAAKSRKAANAASLATPVTEA